MSIFTPSMSWRLNAQVLVWPRAVALHHPELGTTFTDAIARDDLTTLVREPQLPASLAAYAQAQPNEACRLDILDRRYANALPGWCDPLRDDALALYRSRLIWSSPRSTWPSLPSACLRRARTIAALDPARVHWHDDADGASLWVAHLCPKAEVVVVEPEPWQRAWLERSAAVLGVSARLRIVASSEEVLRAGEAADVVVHPLTNAADLRRGLAAAQPLATGGHLVAQVATDGIAEMLRLPTQHGFELVGQHRECDALWIPGPIALEAARDVAVFSRSGAISEAPALEDEGEVAECLRITPYTVHDFNDLVAEPRGATLSAVADLLARTGPHPETQRVHTPRENGELLAWYDDAGYGVTLELSQTNKHVIAILAPYHAGLDFALHWAVLSSLGDGYSRARTVLAPVWYQEDIFV